MDCRSAVVVVRRSTNTAVRLRVSPTVSFRREGRSVAPVHQYFAASNAPAFGKHTYNTATIGAHGSECVSRGLWKRRSKKTVAPEEFVRSPVCVQCEVPSDGDIFDGSDGGQLHLLQSIGRHLCAGGESLACARSRVSLVGGGRFCCGPANS